MSHHASGPNFGFPRGDARLDMTDLYAFLKPGDPAKSVIVLNVHPSFALSSPEPTTSEPFKPERCTNSKSTLTVMPSPIFVTACSSHLLRTESRLRQFVVPGAREPSKCATAAK